MPPLSDEQRKTVDDLRDFHEGDARRFEQMASEANETGESCVDVERWQREEERKAEALTALLARNAELEAELAEVYVEAFCEIAYQGNDGWWDTQARSTAVCYGDRLVELGLWEKDEARGHGRVQWYRPKESK